MMFSLETNTDTNIDKYTEVSDLVITCHLIIHCFRKVRKTYIRSSNHMEWFSKQMYHNLIKVFGVNVMSLKTIFNMMINCIA